MNGDDGMQTGTIAWAWKKLSEHCGLSQDLVTLNSRGDMISKHFSRYEFTCKCGCGFGCCDIELFGILERIREAFGPVFILSGCRCVNHNARVGGATNSLHVMGMAADFKVRGASPEQIVHWLNNHYPGRYGIGRYKTWTHLDVRRTQARWGE